MSFTVSRCCKRERRDDLEEPTRMNGRFQNHWHLFQPTARAKRRLRSSSAMYNYSTFALLILLTSCCSAFVVSDRNHQKTKSHLFYATASTKAEPTWRERIEEEQTESSDGSYGSFHPRDRLFIMQVDELEEEEPISEEDARAEESSLEDEELLERRRKAQARAALLAKRGGGRTNSSSRTTTKDTSVGARRIGSATLNRRGGSAQSQILDGLRKTAQGTSSPDKKNTGSNKEPPTSAQRISQGIVTSAIEDLLAHRVNSIKNNNNNNNSQVNQGVSLRLATPQDDVEIANLRLSVFADFSPDLQNQFCARSCHAIQQRRLRGATCFVATAPIRNCLPGTRSDVILGSAECSFHEFVGTRLGRRRLPQSILYVTEVAVSPSARRRRIGSKLLDAVFGLAQNRCAETLYLHVDVENYGALKLYEQAGYQKVVSDDPMYDEFTKSLNLHPGATKGREHFLLYKNVAEPTWLADTPRHEDMLADCSSHRSKELVGVLGFEIPA